MERQTTPYIAGQKSLHLSLVPILKPFWRHLVEQFETITLPSKRMERQTTPYIAGQESLHKSLSRQQEKSPVTIKITVPKSPINFTPNTCVSAAERVVKNEKFALKFASSAFLRCLWWGPRQRRFARWFHPQPWLVHLKFERSNSTAPRIRAQIQMGQSELRMKPPGERPLSQTPSQEPQESRRGKL